MKKATTEDKLVAFLYVLMRDRLVPGAVEEIMERFVECNETQKFRFTNGYLAEHAKDVARRLRR